MAFSFTHLPTELALEIVRVASLPDYDDFTAPRPSYATAVSMASVSHAMRSATMPHLLHTVVLASSPQVLSFIDAILLQKHLATASSPLSLDYPKLVRRFWTSECWEAHMGDSPDYRIDYAALYEVIRGVDSLGLNFRALHLLYNSLASPNADPARTWKCRRVILAGSSLPRWKPLTSSTEGMIFLSRITHLTLWITADHLLPLRDETRRVPHWIDDMPFVFLLALTHLAFPLRSHAADGVTGNSEIQAPTGILVYIAPINSSDFTPCDFRQWALSSDPLRHGALVPFRHSVLVSGVANELGWQFLFMAGEADAAWMHGDRLHHGIDEDEEGERDMDCE
ncbi:hypothetical protein C8R45DRAFT_137239 [Mycena sanguinolenta]|nr:hypothetical protein C8R45DRAFT_137239 [Mycena sanguinolenta]